MVRIEFEFECEYGTFRDALILPEDHSYTEEELQAMKQERFDNWYYIVKNPPQSPEVPVTTAALDG